MAGPAPKTKDWSARENIHKPKGVHIIVSGSVQVSATNKIAVLSETKGPGDALCLDLEIETGGGEGGQMMVWTPAVFHREVDTDQFNKVDIRWEQKTIATVPVIDDRQHAAASAERHKAQNAAAGTASKAKKAGAAVKKSASAPKPAAAKPTAKKAKTVVKKVAKAAKKGAKSTKKAAKKPAKKVKKPAPKKSTLKKLVKKLVKKFTPATAKKKGRR